MIFFLYLCSRFVVERLDTRLAILDKTRTNRTTNNEYFVQLVEALY